MTSLPELGERPSKRRGTGLFRFVLPLIAVWLIPVLVVAGSLILSQTLERGNVRDELSSTVTVGERLDDAQTTVDATLSTAKATELVIFASGLVTKLGVPAGSTLATGDSLIEIDHRLIRAYVADVPIASDVGPGSVGVDVELVGAMLGVAIDGGKYNRRLGQSISTWNKAAGWPADGLFRRASVIFVPASNPQLGEVEAAIGAVVQEGASIGMTVPPVAALEFGVADGALPSLLFDAPLIIETGDSAVPLSTLQPTGDELQQIAAVLRQSNVDVVADGQEETYSGVSIRLANAVREGTVPNGAIYVGLDGTYCVGVQTSGRFEVVVLDAVNPLGVSGTSSVTSNLIGKSIVRDAESVGDESWAACAS